MDYTENTSASHSEDSLRNLAQWLQQILFYPIEDTSTSGEKEVLNSFELPIVMQYHPTFYQKLPDFIMALLQNDPNALTDYAPLLYHLAGCAVCREAYVELYAAMKEAVQVHEELPIVSEMVRPLSAMPPRLLAHFSRALISQAETLLRQAHREHTDNDAEAHREHTDNDAEARSLLQMAMRISAHLTQQSIRSRARHDLVRVASLYSGESIPDAQQPPALAFTSVPAGAGGTRQGHVLRLGKITPQSTDQATIYLQAKAYEGDIIQHEDTLELQLRSLNTSLRGHRLAISVPLGSLIEPVRWVGGNPHAIIATTLVNEKGMLQMPLGQTELRLQNPEERKLLEVMFSLLEVRIAD
ncbi:MAG TPA: hypothetical protein VNG51_18970 [Ktedonobacteraceae bacterium]|nr:hypothetical protein [Ktedonobacteraceae bacterium]